MAMQTEQIRALREQQRRFFQTGRTRDVDFRMDQLRRLRKALEDNEERIFDALRSDLGKPRFESYGGELGFMLEEIRHALGNLRSWAKPQRVPTPLSLFPSRSEILSEPRGVVLILGPWNYPFMLLLTPLIGAIVAGNCSVIKPSELAPASSRMIGEMMAATFPAEYVAVVEGDRDTGAALLEEKWDYIFFTGGAAVGAVVAQAAARHMTPCTLELGGKSPCIVASDANIEVTAKRIAWAKCYNAGQNCVSPDYLLAHSSIKARLLERIAERIREFLGPDPSQSPDFARIINEKHFDRIERLLSCGRMVLGGGRNREQRYMAPVILDDVTPEDPVMAEEIFGPVLPVLQFETVDEAVSIVQRHPAPLSLYLFTRSKALVRDIFSRIAFGGGCVNDAMIHLANPYLPFGGIGQSGAGAYHGKYSFDTFSHRKSIVSTPLFPDLPIRYQPYRDKLRLLKKIMK